MNASSSSTTLNVRRTFCLLAFLAVLVYAWGLPSARAASASVTDASVDSRLTDTIYFGNLKDEAAHQLSSTNADLMRSGGLENPARRLLPLDPPTWEGGRLSFEMKVDPESQNYFTIKLWGSDVSRDRLVLFIEGKQVGYHHLGDVDLLDFGNNEDQPPFNDRFFYNTSPLPIELTRGKREIACEIRSIGPIWGYGSTFDEYQKTMTEPTRGIYAVYTHTNGYFVPPSREAQGVAPLNPPVRQQPGEEVFDKLKARVNAEIASELKSSTPLNEMQMQFLARAYAVGWTAAFHNPTVIRQVTRGMDALFQEWQANPQLADSDTVTPNPGWFEFGPAGEAVTLLAQQISGELDEPIEGGTLTRRAAWSQLLRAGRDYHTHHRRLYSNQSMITDLNICWSNRGVEAIDPQHALPDGQVLHYLYQSVGLEPWLGSEGPGGPEKPMGDHYFELTEKGLSKELGYVGYYGEVLDWVTSIYNATRATPDQPGDERIRQQIIKLAKARAIFRYPALDADGYRAMRIETMVGWRDDHRPGDVCYAERATWDASTLYIAAATLDPTLTGFAQQMFLDGQYFDSVNHELEVKGLRTTAGLLATPDEYHKMISQPASSDRLPMSPGQPDFVWADEQDGVVAIKHGSEVLYASLYWRARQAVNFLARVHDVEPQIERVAVVSEGIQFEPSGRVFARPDNIDPQAPHGIAYPEDLHSAEAGEQLPIARFSEGHKRKPGEEDPSAGRGSFYTLRYGNFLIGMNSTTDQTFTLQFPDGVNAARDLVKQVSRRGPISVGPQNTAVVWLGDSIAN